MPLLYADDEDIESDSLIRGFVWGVAVRGVLILLVRIGVSVVGTVTLGNWFLNFSKKGIRTADIGETGAAGTCDAAEGVRGGTDAGGRGDTGEGGKGDTLGDCEE